MGIEWIIAGIVSAIAAIFGTYFSAKRIGAAEQRINQATESASRIVESNNKATEAQLKASKINSEVQNEIISLNDGDAVGELRKHYQRD